jgi:Tol biopolymer transport system component
VDTPSRPGAFAHYQVGEKLGQGGMGEVYRATDTKLGRSVAIKFLPEAMASDPVHMARFTREAQVLASLNHPNIAAIYGVEDRALIMELVEGQTLADRIKSGPIAVDDALGIARQIADALEAAHAKGIVHRDLKPANIKIAPDGTVKVLDFGLAKTLEAAPVALDLSPTMMPTQAGFILGTAGYMAPEQARGKEVDKRADIWAFGVVLYEMLTGTQLFLGETVTDVMAAVVRETPDLRRVPARVRPVLQRCLEKDPKRRLRDIGDAMLLVDAVSETSPSAAPQRSSRPMWIAVGTAAAAIAALAALAFVYSRREPAQSAAMRFTLEFPPDVSPIGSNLFAVSPDGRHLAYALFGADGVARIWLRALDTLTWRELPGSEIDRGSMALFWSPDSRFLAYWHDQKLKRIDITGGPTQTITDVSTLVGGGSWNRDGVILFAVRDGMMQVPAIGGTPTPVTKPAEGELHSLPQFLPDGRHFLYLRGGSAMKTRGVYIGSLDEDAESQDSTPLLRVDFVARYVAGRGGSSGHVLFVRDNTLLAQLFDADTRQLGGEPFAVATQLSTNNQQGSGHFSASDTGVLVYFTITDPGVQLTWFNRSGEQTGNAGKPGSYGTIKLSPNGNSLAAVRFEGNNQDIWQVDLATGTPTRFTFDPGFDTQPVWSADGSQIAWVSMRNKKFGLYSKRADGSGGDELLYEFESAEGPSPSLTDWTRDGRFLIFAHQADVWALPISEGTAQTRKPIRLVQGDGSQLGAYVSPDMKWIAYMSNVSNRQEMFVRPFAPGSTTSGSASAGAQWMVSNGTLGMARWRNDGGELLFLGSDGTVMSVEVTPGEGFKASPPNPLFQLPRTILTRTGTPGSIVDVTRDHQRFLLSLLTADVGSGLKVALNWQP